MPADASKRSAIARRGAQGLHDSFYEATDPGLPQEERERLAEQERRKFYSSRATMGAYARNASASTRAAITRAARQAAWQKFYDATDPAQPEEVRQQQATEKRSEFFRGLALKRSTARKRAAIAQNRLIEAEAEAAALDADAV